MFNIVPVKYVKSLQNTVSELKDEIALHKQHFVLLAESVLDVLELLRIAYSESKVENVITKKNKYLESDAKSLTISKLLKSISFKIETLNIFNIRIDK